MDMSRIRIEGLLAAFPKLVGTGKQHTYVETENVRYVYQPMEGLYLLLVTNKQSNILEDIDTLRLLSKIIPEFAESLEEESIAKAAFDLIFAFDEVISLGHKENVTTQQVKQNCAMESHEEILHKLIIKSKIQETKEIMKKKANDLDKARLDQKAGKAPGPAPMATTSTVTGGAVPSISRTSTAEVDSAPTLSMMSGGPSRPSRGPSKGMQLGKAKKTMDILESLAKEGEMVEETGPKITTPAGTMVISDPVFLAVEEKLAVTLDRQGGLEGMEIQGQLSLVVSSEEEAFVRVAIRTGSNKGYQFKTHPKIDKNLYSSENVLGLVDPSRPFPTGSELGILKWRMQTRDESLVPLTISCWPSNSGGQSYVNLEYESISHLDLQNVMIAIPLPHMNHAPTVNSVDGDWRYDPRRSALIWTIDHIDDTNRSGTLEFVVPGTDGESFYPIEASFSCSKTMCDLEVDVVEHTQKGVPIKYGFKRILQTTAYQII